MDEKKHPNQPQTGKEKQEAEKTPAVKQEAPKLVKSRRLFSKKWAYPAVYLGAAALIIGLMYVKSQMGGSNPASSTNVDTGAQNPSQSTQSTKPTFDQPYARGTDASVSLGYFPVKGSANAQAATLVSYDNAYYPHEGYDYKTKDSSAFQVTASASGKVIKVEDDKLYGQTIIVDSGDGYTERYESLGSVEVKQGDAIRQGQVLGTSGTCEFEKSAGDHLYFAIYKDGQPVDPGSLLPKM